MSKRVLTPNKYRLSKKADKDIEAILVYGFGQFGGRQALKYKKMLETCLQLLADNPELGRQCDEIREGVRRHEHQRHIIFYRQRDSDIFVVRVIHNSMDIKRRF